MSDYHETALKRYEEEQDQLHREELEREEELKRNPYEWLIETSAWEDWSSSKEALIREVEEAHRHGLKVKITRFKK